MELSRVDISELQIRGLLAEAEACQLQGTSMSVDPNLMVTFLVHYAVSKEKSSTQRIR